MPPFRRLLLLIGSGLAGLRFPHMGAGESTVLAQARPGLLDALFRASQVDLGLR